jgi:hypothetical protein
MNLADLNPLAAIGGKLIDRFLPDPAAAAKAKAELDQMKENGELARMANETDLYKTEQNNLTDRLKADMSSDSWLSKNIRPMTLVYILVAYMLLAILDASVLDIADSFVELLGQWGMLVMSFYFGGRTLEKIMDMKSSKKEEK